MDSLSKDLQAHSVRNTQYVGPCSPFADTNFLCNAAGILDLDYIQDQRSRISAYTHATVPRIARDLLRVAARTKRIGCGTPVPWRHPAQTRILHIGPHRARGIASSHQCSALMTEHLFENKRFSTPPNPMFNIQDPITKQCQIIKFQTQPVSILEINCCLAIGY